MIDITVRAELDGTKLIIPVKEYSLFIKGMLSKRDGILSIRLDVPTKKKTSPENRLLHALIAQLAMYRETSLELMKRYLKITACTSGYPYDMISVDENGKTKTIVEPKSVSDASTTEVALLIETAYLIAGEWGVHLEQPGGL